MAYVEFDEYGMKVLKCMNCEQTIGSRTYVELPDRHNINKVVNVLAFKKHANYNLIDYELESGAYVSLMLCTDCKDRDINFRYIQDQVIEALDIELTNVGKSRNDINDRLDKRRINFKLKERSRIINVSNI